jgi:hypothetical protein
MSVSEMDVLVLDRCMRVQVGVPRANHDREPHRGERGSDAVVRRRGLAEL